MFKLNVKIALRNLWKNKTASFINVTGLAIGLAACLMLLVYVTYEWNFDKQAKNSANVYEVMTNIKDDNGSITKTFDGTTTALGPLLREKIPEIKHLARMSYVRNSLIANGENGFKKDGKFAEPGILKLFDYQFIAGDAASAMQNPKSVILTETMAATLFGTTDVLNKTVRYQDREDLTVTGVIKDLPDNMSAKFDFLMPWAFYEMVDGSAKGLKWDSYSFVTLFSVDANADIDRINQKIDAVVKAERGQEASAHFAFPFTKLHLYGKFKNGQSVGGDIEQIWLFMGLAFGILLIACINFMNMATAKSEKRAKEVGIKKTIGANRSSLVMQFLTESMALTLVAVIMAIAMVEICLPAFNTLLRIKLSIAYFNAASWTGIIGMVLLTGLIAGSYPAFYLSSFNPMQTLKKKIGRNTFSISLRQVLVAGQFCFAIILIISTLVIYRQIQYVKNRPLGININALVEIPQDGQLRPQFDVYKERLLRSGAVTSMNKSSTRLAHHGANFTDIRWPGMIQESNHIMFNKVETGYDFVQTNGLKLLEGRDFSEKFASDTAAVLLSKSAVKTMNLANPIGESVVIFGDKKLIVGVFDDYVWDSPYKSNNPMVLYFNNKYTNFITMRLNTANSLQENINTITAITKEINPAYPVEITFQDTAFAVLLEKERILGILANLFGGLAIFISCLGLFGLVTYSAEQRTKEFGVRRVLGASVANLMQLLSVSFMKVIMVAIVIAIPVSYYAMNRWLSQFEFRTGISWWIIPVAAVSILGIALLTISIQAYKSAKANPVDALKYE